MGDCRLYVDFISLYPTWFVFIVSHVAKSLVSERKVFNQLQVLSHIDPFPNLWCSISTHFNTKFVCHHMFVSFSYINYLTPWDCLRFCVLIRQLKITIFPWKRKFWATETLLVNILWYRVKIYYLAISDRIISWNWFEETFKRNVLTF